MDMRSLDHQTKVMEWKELITECRRSGKAVKEWCNDNSIKPSTYYYWLKVIRNEALVLTQSQSSVPHPQFAPVRIKEEDISVTDDNCTCAVLRYNSFSLEINNGANLKVLEHTLKVLGNLC
jgi:putative transposase